MRTALWALATVAGIGSAADARASLTTSETEQIRGYITSETHADRVRSLVARPDLSADESAEAMTAALSGVPLDAPRMAFLGEVVQGGGSTASRPVLAVAAVRAVLGRVDALYAQHPANLEHSSALAEIARGYVFVAGEASGADAGVDASARAGCGKALADHLAHNASLLKVDVAVPVQVAHLRAQAAVALLDAMPDGPMRRVDAADRLGLTGARRAALVELGVLVTDASGADGRVTEVRALLDRMPGARDGAEAVFVGDTQALFRARFVVVSTDDAPAGPLGEAASPWGPEGAPAEVPASTMAIARGLAVAAVRRAVDRRPALRARVDHDGLPAVATAVAMLAVDAPRTLDVAAARFLAGKRDTLAAVADALGVLAAFAPPVPAADGLAVPLGHARATHVSLDPAGVATAFRLDAHLWRLEHDDAGAITGLHRDGSPVVASMLPAARVVPTEGDSWTGSGLVFARLAGAPRAAISAGPRVRVVGSSVGDAVSAPAPGDDAAVEADLRIDGGPAGVVVRAVAGTAGFKGVSLLLVPGAPAHAVLLTADGAGADLAASPVVELPATPTHHVRLAVRGTHVDARIDAVTLSATLPADLAHGDVALRAYPGVSVEATGWRVAKP
jgi:hypothetical protein